MAKVSVIIPVFNQAQFVIEAINSVLNQTYIDFEIVVVDDGSTDNTMSTVKTIKDGRVKYTYQKNKGLAGARNTGLKLSCGEYVAFLDSDDWFLPDKLELQTQILNNNPSIGFIAGGWIIVDENRGVQTEVEPWKTNPEINIEKLLMGNLFAVHSPLVRKTWLENVGGFDESLRVVEDWDLWLRIALAGCKMIWVERMVCAYCLHKGSLSSNALKMTQTSISVLQKIFSFQDLPPRLISYKKQAYAQAFLIGACREYGSGQVIEARDDLARAVELNPNLLDYQGKNIIKTIVIQAGYPLIDDPFRYLETIFNNLPSSAKSLHRHARGAMAQAAFSECVREYQRSNWTLVHRLLIIIMVNDPILFFNRGTISIALQSFGVGKKIHTFLKWLSRRKFYP